MMRSRVGLGMCLAEGASFSTADTVPAESPTWAATAFSVTIPFESSVFFFSTIVLMVQDGIRAASCSRPKASYYIAIVYFGETRAAIHFLRGMTTPLASQSRSPQQITRALLHQRHRAQPQRLWPGVRPWGQKHV